MNKTNNPEQTSKANKEDSTNFYHMFLEAESSVISYKGKTVQWWDIFSVSKGEKIRVTFESTSSEWEQGISLSMWGRFEVLEPTNAREKNSVSLWEGLDPKETVIQLFPGKRPKNKDEEDLPEESHLMVQNMWDTDQVVESQMLGAAMQVEKVNETTNRYYCNDGHLDDDFDDLVFTIERLGIEKPAKIERLK